MVSSGRSFAQAWLEWWASLEAEMGVILFWLGAGPGDYAGDVHCASCAS
jgi:hypothetical protein